MRPSLPAALHPDAAALIALALVQLAVVAIVQPRGEFPVNDDWAFAQSAAWLVTEGRVRLSDWSAMNLLPQTLLGGGVTALSGFSFEALRHLTQGIAMACLGAAYAFFRVNRMPPRDAFVAAATLVAFPSWAVLSNTFMTDLYGLLFGLAAATCLLGALGAASPARWIAAGAVLAVLGALERQVVLVVPFAFAVAWLASRRPWRPRDFVIAGLPLALGLAAVAAYQAHLAAGPGLPEAMLNVQGRVPALLRKAVLDEDGHGRFVVSNAMTLAGHLGLAVMAWALWWGLPRRRAWLVAVGGGAFVVFLAALALDALPPYRPHQVMDRAGIGPFMLRGSEILDRSAGAFWTLAGAAAALGAAVLAAMAVQLGGAFARMPGERAAPVFLATVLGAYLAPFVVTDYFDRYVLFALPFAIALWPHAWTNPAPRRSLRLAGACWLALVITLGAIATRDYFSWNRARWDAVREAQRLGATPATLDAGFEYNGFHGFESRREGTRPGPSWWWVKDDLYVVSLAPAPGYRVEARFTVRALLPRTPREVFLLRRDS